MESPDQRNQTRNVVAQPSDDIGRRAADALNRVLPTRHGDKTAAQMFECSVRMAQYLRAGQHWSLKRLAQASSAIGSAFDRAIYSPTSPADFHDELREVAERLARLEERANAEMVGGLDAGLAPAASAAAHPPGGEMAIDP